MNVLSTIGELKKDTYVNFKSRPDVKQAEDDFKYLCTSSYCVVLHNMGLLGVSKSGKHLMNVACVPVKSEDKQTAFPKSEVRLDDPKMYIATVHYKDGKAKDVLCLPASLFQNVKPETGFSKFLNKVLMRKPVVGVNDSGEYVLNISGAKAQNLRKYAFGNIISQLGSEPAAK